MIINNLLQFSSVRYCKAKMYNILHHFPVWLSIKLVCVEGQRGGGTLNFWGGGTFEIPYHIQRQFCFFTLD